jgi:hypothetical protein
MIETLIYYPALPAIPDGLLDTADAYNRDELLGRAFDRSASKDGVSIPNTTYRRHPVSEKICDWVKENIGSDYTDLGISFHGKPGGVALPHTDKSRNWTLMWLLDEGGPAVDTVYWQEGNHPVIRNTRQ